MKSREQFIKDLAPKKFTKPEKIWLGLLLVIILAGMLAYVDQVRKGLQVTSLNDYALWGIYISNFVFFIATSFVGAATVAILRLTKNSWRTPEDRSFNPWKSSKVLTGFFKTSSVG